MCVCSFYFFFLMIRRPPRSTRTDTLFPYTTLFRSRAIIQLDIDNARIGHEARLSGPAALGKEKRIWSPPGGRSEEHTSELQSLMRISYAVFCLKKKTRRCTRNIEHHNTITNSVNNNKNKYHTHRRK